MPLVEDDRHGSTARQSPLLIIVAGAGRRQPAGLADFLLQEFGGAAHAAVHLGAIPDASLRLRQLHQCRGHRAEEDP